MLDQYDTVAADGNILFASQSPALMPQFFLQLDSYLGGKAGKKSWMSTANTTKSGIRIARVTGWPKVIAARFHDILLKIKVKAVLSEIEFHGTWEHYTLRYRRCTMEATRNGPQKPFDVVFWE